MAARKCPAYLQRTLRGHCRNPTCHTCALRPPSLRSRSRDHRVHSKSIWCTRPHTSNFLSRWNRKHGLPTSISPLRALSQMARAAGRLLLCPTRRTLRPRRVRSRFIRRRLPIRLLKRQQGFLDLESKYPSPSRGFDVVGPPRSGF